jgi:hypothetical protein
MFVLLRGRLGSLDGARIARTAVRSIVAGSISGAAAFGIVTAWRVPATERNLLVHGARVGLAIIVGVLVFAISALILRVGEVDDLRKAVLRRFR